MPKDYCDRCLRNSDYHRSSAEEDVQPVQERFGFGRTRTQWLRVSNWCRSCRENNKGRWRKAEGFVEAPKTAADVDLFTPFEGE